MPVLIPALDALTMALLNFSAATILTVLLAVNAWYEWTNVFVTVVAPFAAASFLVTAVIWVLVLARTLRRQRANDAAPAVPPPSPSPPSSLDLPHRGSAPLARRLVRRLGRRDGRPRRSA